MGEWIISSLPEFAKVGMSLAPGKCRRAMSDGSHWEIHVDQSLDLFFMSFLWGVMKDWKGPKRLISSGSALRFGSRVLNNRH
jgi:hypothetical protein